MSDSRPPREPYDPLSDPLGGETDTGVAALVEILQNAYTTTSRPRAWSEAAARMRVLRQHEEVLGARVPQRPGRGRERLAPRATPRSLAAVAAAAFTVLLVASATFLLSRAGGPLQNHGPAVAIRATRTATTSAAQLATAPAAGATTTAAPDPTAEPTAPVEAPL